MYSLGVCLLEIGLWQSFIVEENNMPSLSDYFLAAAEEHVGCIESDFKKMEANTPDEERYKPMALLCASDDIVRIFEAIERARLL